ncbi:hypothetical protein MHU86_9969 [Fragilaria crotonensis]|nr:hypothetical protein MHU86_9969 [Fragilaria crotonensis]
MDNTSTAVDYTPAAMFDAIPSKLQLPIVVVIALLGFLLVLGLSKMTTAPLPEDKKSKGEAASHKTPPRKGKKGTDALGIIETPSGRRSARLASRRKED